MNLQKLIRSPLVPWFYVAAVWANCAFWVYVILSGGK